MVILPPPEVLAFCAIVIGCRSTTRVVSCLYSSGVGGSSLNLPSRFGGSLNAQCLISPCPPCITAQRTPSQLFRYAVVSPLGKCRFSSGITRSFLMRLKHRSLSAFSKDKGWSADTSLPSIYHSSIPQKWADLTAIPNSLTILATSGNCSVGPMGPQIPTGLSGVDCCQALTYSRASAR